jgi:hypothetical protein
MIQKTILTSKMSERSFKDGSLKLEKKSKLNYKFDFQVVHKSKLDQALLWIHIKLKE